MEGGTVGSGELAILIHDWDRGPQRELFKKYNYGLKELNVAYAIVTGILDERTVDGALLQALERELAFYRENLGSRERQNIRRGRLVEPKAGAPL